MLERKKLPSIDRLHEAFLYDAYLGRLIWRKRVGDTQAINSWNAKNFGKIAGAYVGKDRLYRSVKLDRRLYLEHRLIWAWHGRLAFDELDHRNGVGDDNRIENLRPAGRGQNIQNQKLRQDNRVQFKGVITRCDGTRFGARITVRGKRYTFGWSDTPEQAHAAYCAEAVKHFGEFARAV